jgi:hypothetical protein
MKMTTVLKGLLIAGAVCALLFITPSAVKTYLQAIPDHSAPLFFR